MSLYKKILEDYEKGETRLSGKFFFEIVYFPVFGISFLLLEFGIIKLNGLEKFYQEYELTILFFFLGLFHVLASNVLSFLYNLQRITPFFLFLPIATPRGLKLFGCTIIVVSFLFGVFRNST